MTKKPFHSMSEDFDELEIEPVRMREPDIPDDWLEAETGEASKPRDKSAGEIHMSWLNENSHSKPREWWIKNTKAIDVRFGNFVEDGLDKHHVIEKSAYRYAVDQWDYWVEEARKAQAERDALKAENAELRFELEAKQRPLGEQVLELKLENERLIKERIAYRTLNSLMGDNGRICELHDEMDELKAEAEKLAEALNKYIYPPEDPGSSLAIEAINQWKEFTDGK